MIGCYDFCGHYDWTFEWLRQRGGDDLVRNYWKQAIAEDSQLHAAEWIQADGIEGMKKYWAHTLEEEAAGYSISARDDVFRVDMHDCPSKGFLLRNGIEQHCDYCDHCMGWIGPVMEKAGFVVDHEHNHCGQCWWEMRRKDSKQPPSPPGTLSGAKDVRNTEAWSRAETPHDVFSKATNSEQKKSRGKPDE